MAPHDAEALYRLWKSLYDRLEALEKSVLKRLGTHDELLVDLRKKVRAIERDLRDSQVDEVEEARGETSRAWTIAKLAQAIAEVRQDLEAFRRELDQSRVISKAAAEVAGGQSGKEAGKEGRGKWGLIITAISLIVSSAVAAGVQECNKGPTRLDEHGNPVNR